MSTTRSFVALALMFALPACSGSIPTDRSSGSEDGSDEGDGDGDDEGGGGGDDGGGGETARACVAGPVFVGPAPITRLTNIQYQNTVKTLFPTLTFSAATLPPEIRRPGGFVNQGEAQNPSPLLVEQLDLSAGGVAKAVSEKLPGSLGCATPLDEMACGNAYVKSLLEKAFRRPPTSDELERYRALFATSRTEFGFAEAVALVVRTVLQSPHFLYRVERGEDPQDQGSVASLTSFELATRLSYFLTNNTPDAELMAAAKSGALLKREELAAQAKRLLKTPAARGAVSDFQGQWLKLEKLGEIEKSTKLFPEFNDALRTSYKTSLNKFLEYQTWERGGTWRGLLTDRTTFANKELAKIYDLNNVPSGMEMVSLDDRRAGLLSQAGLLANLAHVDVDSPTKRGVFVLENLLCQHVPEPPIDTNTAVPVPDKPMTMRQRMEDLHSATGACKSCHQLIDGIGFGFSNFDAIGRHRTQENGIATDDKGSIVAGVDIDGDFRGVVELSEKLAGSRDGALCYASQVLAYGRSLSRSDLDECAAEQILQAAGIKNPSIQDLLLAVTTSEGFRSLDKSKL